MSILKAPQIIRFPVLLHCIVQKQRSGPMPSIHHMMRTLRQCRFAMFLPLRAKQNRIPLFVNCLDATSLGDRAVHGVVMSRRNLAFHLRPFFEATTTAQMD